MRYERASSARAAGSGGTSSGGGPIAVAPAGVPAASVNLSKPAGVCTVRNRGLRTGHHEGVRQLPRQDRGRSRSGGASLSADLDPNLAVEHQEGLLVGQMPVHGTAIAPLTVVFQDGQAPGSGVAAGADADQRPQEPDRLLKFRRKNHRTARRVGTVLFSHSTILARAEPSGPVPR